MKLIKKYRLPIILVVGFTLILLFNISKVNGVSLPELTTEQKVKEFEYMYQLLKTEYPLFGVKLRQTGIDWLAKKDEYLERIKATPNNKDYYEVLYRIVAELKDGHTRIVSPTCYKQLKEAYANIDLAEGDPWLEALEAGEKNYPYWNKVIKNRLNKLAVFFYKKTGRLGVKFDTFHNEDTAYLKVQSFNLSEEECQALTDYIQAHKACSNIIIDIRGNSGGNASQWMNHIVAPMLSEALSAPRFIAFRGGPVVNKLLNSRLKDVTVNVEDYLKPIAQLPEGLNYPPELFYDFAFYEMHKRLIEPQDSINYQGNIYLLVDHKVYSSSEGFASWCKETKFATLVGERTGGDGGSISPMLQVLPHSGLLLRFRLQLTLNPDGTASAEYGTTPDIEVSADNALEEVLSVIENKKE